MYYRDFKLILHHGAHTTHFDLDRMFMHSLFSIAIQWGRLECFPECFWPPCLMFDTLDIRYIKCSCSSPWNNLLKQLKQFFQLLIHFLLLVGQKISNSRFGNILLSCYMLLYTGLKSYYFKGAPLELSILCCL